MSRKGQYLAVETVAAFSIGLLIATATISVFNYARNDITENSEASEVKAVEAKVVKAIYTLEMIDQGSGTKRVNLPSSLGGSAYQLLIENDKLKIRVDSDTYVVPLEEVSQGAVFEGSVEIRGTGDSTSTVQIRKQGNQYMISVD
ncbi:MAG: hypothetical protein ABEK01_02585 [Candidatus Nanohaloarchaea archaeon]